MKTLLRNGMVIVLVMFTFGMNPVWADDDDDDDDEAEKSSGPRVSLLQVALEVNSSGPFAGSFDTLIAAVLKADPSIVITLSKRGQRTVFAPTDDAFLALGLDETNIGDALSRETLTAILKYHIVRGRLLAEDVLAKRRLNTLLRGRKGFVRQSGGVLIDNLHRPSTIIVTDVEASNGVIHAIDGVLLPVEP